MGTNYYVKLQDEKIVSNDGVVGPIGDLENCGILGISFENDRTIGPKDGQHEEKCDDDDSDDDGFEKVHLGKASSGWSFLWNFHNRKYYNDSQSLIAFVLNHQVVDEYGKEIDSIEFLQMTLWCVYAPLHENLVGCAVIRQGLICGESDLIIDGLRVSSCTTFC